MIENRYRRWIGGFVKSIGHLSYTGLSIQHWGAVIGRGGKRVLLRHYLEQGTTKVANTRQVGVSRDTIHRWIRTGQLDRDLVY